MPAEWFVHKRTWMAWPHWQGNWRAGAVPAQRAFLSVALAIAEFEPVAMCVPPLFMDKAKLALSELADSRGEAVKAWAARIDLLPIDTDDAWMRDSGPSFVFDPTIGNGLEKMYGMDWIFNAWGGLYKPDKDLLVPEQVLVHSGIERKVMDFVLEGGSFHVDGEGTILTTEECLLHPNRNPHLSKADIEAKLKHFLGGDKVIWLPKGLVNDDDTNGHIDNICCFSKPGEVVLAWTDDQADPQYAISQQAMEVFQNIPDARGRLVNVVKLPIPPAMHYTAEDLEGLETEGEEDARQAGVRMAGSYVNFYIANGGIICPQFGFPEADQMAVEILQRTFPAHKVSPVSSKDILLGGGNIHCITQQEPLPQP